jgi:competence protein ComEC
MNRYIVLGIILIVCNSFVWTEIVQGQSSRVVFFDVGQGDSIFVTTQQGHQVLIDGGPNEKVLEKLGKYMAPWDRSIDMVVLTHPDADHVTGLPSVLEHYQVKHVLWTGVVKDTTIARRFEQAVAQENAQVTFAKAGQSIFAGEAVFYVVYPFEVLQGQTSKKVNDTSVVVQLVGKKDSVLLTGDISDTVEKQLLEQNIQAGILKVAHHGSKSSSSAVFLQAVAPHTGVILVAHDNWYGHPHNNVLVKLAGYGIQVMRTDELGDITIEF